MPAAFHHAVRPGGSLQRKGFAQDRLYPPVRDKQPDHFPHLIELDTPGRLTPATAPEVLSRIQEAATAESWRQRNGILHLVYKIP